MAKREEKKKDRKRRLLLLIFLLMFTSLMLITSTYAWFTSNRAVTVDSIDLEVTTVNGLQISANAIEWKAKITKDELIAAEGYDTAVNQFPDSLSAVSTAGNLTNGKLDMFLGNVTANETTGEYELTTTKQTEAHCNGDQGDTACSGKHFVVFDIFLKADSAFDIVLTSKSGVRTTGDADRGIQNTARVAFLVEGNVAATSTSAQMQALNNATRATTKIWEPNYDTHTVEGIAAAKEYYGITTTSPGSILAYRGVKAEITTGVPLNETGNTSNTSFAPVTIDIATAADFADPVEFISLEKGVTKLRIYWWVEGQDVDAENNATGTDMRLDLQFEIA